MKEFKINGSKKITLEEIIIFIIIAMVGMIGVAITRNIDDLDTMWLFSFASKIAQGYVPYLDFNMVVTPLSPQITAVFLKIFGNTMLVSQFIGVIYGVIIFLMQYLILRKLNIGKALSTFITLLSFMVLSANIGDSYNILAYTLVYVLLFVEICKIRYDKYLKLTKKEKYIFKNIDYNTAYNVITGILLGLIVLAKQNIGVIAVLAITIYYFAKCIYSKKKVSEAFYELIIKAIFCIIPIFIELVYLCLTGALYNFIDYTILGLGNFNQKVNSGFIQAILYSDQMVTSLELGIENPRMFLNVKFVANLITQLQNYLLNILMVFSIIFTIVMIIAKCTGKIKRKNVLDVDVMVLSLCFMAVAIIISIPLANQYHLTLTTTLIQFLFLLNIVQFVEVKQLLNKSISKVSYYIMILIPIIIGVSYIMIYTVFAYKSQIDSFSNSHISTKTEYLISDICEYIEKYEKEHKHPLYVVTSNAAMYSIAMNRNNGIFDLPQYGNLGKEDYLKVIDKLDSMNNFSVMIFANEGQLFWQEPKEISEYIKENYEYVEEYDMYKIYYKQ